MHQYATGRSCLTSYLRPPEQVISVPVAVPDIVLQIDQGKSKGDSALSDNLKVILDKLTQFLKSYAHVTSVEQTDGTHVRIIANEGGQHFEFADSPSAILHHVLAFEDVPLWDPTIDTEDDGRWRLFSVHVIEAIETAAADERILVLVDGAVSPRRAA